MELAPAESSPMPKKTSKKRGWGRLAWLASGALTAFAARKHGTPVSRPATTSRNRCKMAT